MNMVGASPFMAKDGKSAVGIGIEKHGGVVSVLNKDGQLGAIVNVDEHGGRVSVRDKDGKSRAIVYVHEHGGSVSVHGKGSSESRAIIGVNKYGNGAISTWDKNGYRLATLK